MPEDTNTQIDEITDPANTESTTTGADNSAFMQEVQNRLLGQSDVISSTDTELESSFNSAIQGVRDARDSNTQRVESTFDRQLGVAERDAESQFSDFSESRTGFGTRMVAFRRLVETTDKELKDLEQRKQELILQGESNAASKIAELQVQQLQFRQQAQQNVFQNLLGLGTFGQQQQQQNLAERQFGLQTQQFRLAGVELAMKASNDAFTRIGQLKSMGALGTLSEEQQSELESDAGLPSGVVNEMANLPAEQEIRAVGDSLLAIDPKTLKTTVLYTQPARGSSGGGGVSLGTDASVSWLTSSVMNGMQSLDDLTPTQQAEVRAEMSKVGFGSENAPEWFRNKLQAKQIRPSFEEEGTATGPQSFPDETVQSEWQKYQESFVYGPRFLSEDFIRKMVPAESIEENDLEPETYYRNQVNAVQGWRDAGFSDDEIAKIMNFR